MIALDGISSACQQRAYFGKRLSRTKDDVWNEEDRADNIVLVANQAQVLVHAFNLCVSDVAAIDVREEI